MLFFGIVEEMEKSIQLLNKYIHFIKPLTVGVLNSNPSKFSVDDLSAKELKYLAKLLEADWELYIMSPGNWAKKM